MRTASERVPRATAAALAAVFILALSLLGGCSTSRLAAGAIVPILENARDAALLSSDVQTFRDAAPANIFLIEGLIRTNPNDPRLRLSACMLYFSYAFSFIEEEDEAYASLLYLRGFAHGKAMLFRRRKIREMWDGPYETFTDMLKYLKKKDIPAIVWTAANWSQFISLHLDSTAVLGDIPRVAALLERSVEIEGDYFEGLPYIMLGSLHAFRPPIMGGSPEKSLENFERAFEVSQGRFLLAKYLYSRYYCYRIQDADEFESTLEWILSRQLPIYPDHRLLNEIARRKANRLLREKDELF